MASKEMSGNDADRPWFCYMLRCRDGSFYVGITNDLEERLIEHNRGKDSFTQQNVDRYA